MLVQVYQLRRTTVWTVGCLALVAGVGLSRFGQVFDASWLWFILPSILLLRKYRALILLFICLLAFGVGWWRGSLFQQKLTVYQSLFDQKITILAEADSDAVYSSNSQLSFDAKNVRVLGGPSLAGKIQLSGFGLGAIYKGDIIQARGKLYPTLGSKQARMSYAQLQLQARRPSLIDNIRRQFAAGLQTALPEPLGSFALGILIGQRSTLPDEIKQDLLMVGLTHIIAVSGYNLTIILHGTRRLLVAHSKRLATALSLGLIAVFLLLTGSSASIVRAAIVSGLSITAAYYGRSFRPLLLISIAAAITAWANPFYVWSDAGWYLSFLAFYGVLMVAPLVARRWRLNRESIVVMVAVESLCAEVMTLPYVLHTFGQISFVGLVANVLVVTLIPLAMLLSLIAGLAGMLLSPLAGLLAWPAKVLLDYMLSVAHIFARLPHAFSQNLDLTLSAMLALYGLVVSLSLLLSHRTKHLKLL